MNRSTLSLLCLTLVTASCSRSGPLPGDTRVPRASPEGSSDIESRVFPPELVMERQSALKLEPEQREAILKEVERAQAEMLRLEWEMSAEREKLAALLDSEKIDEAQALGAAERVMAFENRIKATHLTMLVRVKSSLSAEQQRQLRETRGTDR